MNLKTKSWKTTTAGVLAIVGGLSSLWFGRHALDETKIILATTSLMTGLGLLFSRDNDKTSEDVDAK